jgi:sulfite reductase alpha subunit-like flavoprotein
MESVLAVCTALFIQPDDPYRLRASQSSPDIFIPEHVTPRHLFEQYVDLSQPPPCALVKLFLTTVESRVQPELQELISSTLAEYQASHTTMDFILQYGPLGAPRLEALLSACALIAPRRYCAACSPKSGRGYFELVTELHKSECEPPRIGLCSAFLRANTKIQLAVKIEDGVIQPPKDKGTPFVIIGVGAGIGVAFGLMEFRKHGGGPWGDAIVICEFPRKADAVEVRKRLEEYRAANLLCGILWAFSKETGDDPKSWQEVMRKNVPTIWPVWMDDRSRVFMAGRVGDAEPELKKLLVRMTMNEGGLRDEEAMAWTNRHTIVVEDFHLPKTTL